MKKTCTLAITMLMLSALTCSIAPVNAFVVSPIIDPNTYPWLGDVGYPVDFYAEVDDPSELFIIYPPFDWEWIFEKIEGPWYAPETFTESNENCNNSYWGFPLTFDYCCKYSVEIRVTNNLESTLKWPMRTPCSVNYTLIGYDGDIWGIEPDLYREPFTGKWWCEAIFWNLDETYEVPAIEGGWKIRCHWESPTGPVIGSTDYFNVIPTETFVEDVWFRITPVRTGWWYTIYLEFDSRNDLHESNEENNNIDAYKTVFFW